MSIELTKRGVIVYGNGAVILANGSANTAFDLDAAFKKGAKVLATYPIGAGNAMLLVIEERQPSQS